VRGDGASLRRVAGGVRPRAAHRARARRPGAPPRARRRCGPIEPAPRSSDREWGAGARTTKDPLPTSLLSDPALLASFYDDFVAPCAHRLSPLAVADFAGAAAKARATPADAAAFLRRAATALDETRAPDAPGPLLRLRALAVQADLAAGGPDSVREAARELLSALAALPSPHPSVPAAVHRTAALLAKADGDAGAFYRASLRHLSYVQATDLPPADAAALALDVGLAALLAPDVHSFGELLLHPVSGRLAGADGAWVGALLKALSDGDLAAFDAAVAAHAAAMAAHPSVAAAGAALRDKAAVCALFALAASLAPGGRRLAVAAVAAAARTDADGAEALVMKAVARGLIKATIDGVDGIVQVGGEGGTVLGGAARPLAAAADAPSPPLPLCLSSDHVGRPARLDRPPSRVPRRPPARVARQGRGGRERAGSGRGDPRGAAGCVREGARGGGGGWEGGAAVQLPPSAAQTAPATAAPACGPSPPASPPPPSAARFGSCRRPARGRRRSTRGARRSAPRPPTCQSPARPRRRPWPSARAGACS